MPGSLGQVSCFVKGSGEVCQHLGKKKPELPEDEAQVVAGSGQERVDPVAIVGDRLLLDGRVDGDPLQAESFTRVRLAGIGLQTLLLRARGCIRPPLRV